VEGEIEMNVVIATAGRLDAKAAVAGTRHYAKDGSIKVLTVVEVPRRLLADLRAVYGERVGDVSTSDAEYVGIPPATPTVGRDFPGEDAIIEQYLANQKEKRTGPLVAAFQDEGIDVEVEIRESDHAARTILDYLTEVGADLAVVGASQDGLIDTMLGSVSTRIARHAPCSVLIIR
jgi:nucleotide-binding universal stress UspA family protein